MPDRSFKDWPPVWKHAWLNQIMEIRLDSLIMKHENTFNHVPIVMIVGVPVINFCLYTFRLHFLPRIWISWSTCLAYCLTSVPVNNVGWSSVMWISDDCFGTHVCHVIFLECVHMLVYETLPLDFNDFVVLWRRFFRLQVSNFTRPKDLWVFQMQLVNNHY